MANSLHIPVRGERLPGASGAQNTVLVWCSSVHPAGGMERVVVSIANGLTERAWRVVLAGPFANAPVLRAAMRPEIEFIEHNPCKSVSGLYRTMRFIGDVIRRRGIDVISAHGSLFPLMFTRTPVVWTEHDIRYAGGSMLRGPRGWAWRWIRARVRRGEWRLITVSGYVRSRVCEDLKLAEDQGQVIYNGLPDAEALRALPAPRMTPPYRIGFLGRLEPMKWPLEVFDLSARLNRMGIPHEWNVFGDGELMPEMRARAQRTAGHSVHICGLAKKPEDALARMDLLCFHSRGEQEGLGMVLLEAMAARRLVVAWDSGCIREVLAGKGTLVTPPFEAERFAEAIASVLRRGGSRNDSRDNRWEEGRMIRDYDAVLRSAIGKHAMTARRSQR